VPNDELYEIEVLDGELVQQPGAQVEPAGAERLPVWATQPVVQTAVAAATGFVAGAATMALLRRHALARVEQAGAARPVGPLAAGRVQTFVVHVRTLRPTPE
jgi:hypothetical protein